MYKRQIFLRINGIERALLILKREHHTQTPLEHQVYSDFHLMNNHLLAIQPHPCQPEYQICLQQVIFNLNPQTINLALQDTVQLLTHNLKQTKILIRMQTNQNRLRRRFNSQEEVLGYGDHQKGGDISNKEKEVYMRKQDRKF